ncbi:MAG: hypothetical protein LUF04_04260 [Bacteroides sp.]|nr:hypothetical protein [Bacteroides sp.]
MIKGLNLYEVQKAIRLVFESHPLVNDFLINKYRLNDTDDMKYPGVVFTVNSITRNDSVLKLDTNLLYADRLTDSRDNEIQIQSTGTTVLMECLNVFYEHTDIAVTQGYVMTPFTEQFADNTAGIVTHVSLETPSHLQDCYWLDTESLECFQR